jgi:site-specific DNA-methyltransferase (adenine-specific)
MTYDAADNSAKCYEVAIAALRDKLASFRKEVIGDCTLYLGDCREVLPLLPHVDAVVTDPPYSANTHEMAKTNKGAGHGRKLVSFEALTDDEFAWVADACLDRAKGWVVMTCDYRHAALMYRHERFVRLGAWVKPNPMPQISADRPGQGFETVLIMHAGRDPKLWNRGGGAGVWTHPVVNGAEVPTQKPYRLVSAFVQDFTAPGQTVLDPFLGSGTTAVACTKLGRKFIGIEASPEHFAIACERIGKAYAQPDMFIEPAPKPEQTCLLLPVDSGKSTDPKVRGDNQAITA